MARVDTDGEGRHRWRGSTPIRIRRRSTGGVADWSRPAPEPGAANVTLPNVPDVNFADVNVPDINANQPHINVPDINVRDDIADIVPDFNPPNINVPNVGGGGRGGGRR